MLCYLYIYNFVLLSLSTSSILGNAKHTNFSNAFISKLSTCKISELRSTALTVKFPNFFEKIRLILVNLLLLLDLLLLIGVYIFSDSPGKIFKHF